MTILGLILLLLGGASLIPVSFQNGYRTQSLYIPVVATICYGLYEFFTSIEGPSEMVPFRVDMIILIPLLSLIIFAGMCRWAILLFLVRKKRTDDTKLAVKIQIASFAVVAFIGGAWILTRWFA